MRPDRPRLRLPLAAAGLALALAVLLPAAAHAEEVTPSAAEAVARLSQAIEEPDRPWLELYRLYDAARKAIAETEDEAARKEAEAAYAEIRADVATALQRDRIPPSGWFMGIFAALLLWGGFGWCLRIAMKTPGTHQLDEDETWPIRPEEP